MLGGGATELQMLEEQVANLNRQVEGVKRAENASGACARVIASIQKAEEKDGFVGDANSLAAAAGGPEGAGAANQYHSGAGGSNGGGGGQAEGGCCAVM
jgi:hypothetical protein